MCAASVAELAAGIMDSIHYDETACGPLCQHPLCWASNRRVARGLPRVGESCQDSVDDGDEGSLPTMKVFNLLDEYGNSNKDRYPSTENGKDTKMPAHKRSASAPNIMAAYQRSPVVAPFTPFTSPLGIKGGSVRSTQSAKTTTSRSRSRTTPKISRVEIKEMLSSFGDLPPPNVESSSFYIWCPSKKMYKKRMQGKEEVPQSASKEPVKVKPKDLTDDMVPNVAEKKKQTNKKNKRAVHETPTGGRPYTHPTRSPPPVARRTLPQDIDEGINQLLSLPRDVLMQVLEHIKKSELLDKSKVQLLVSRVMPLIHFAPDLPESPRPTTNNTLLDSGILQNHRVTIHSMEQKAYDKHEFPQASGKVLFLDDTAVSQMASSVVFDEEQVAEEEEIIPSKAEETETPVARSTGRMAKARPLGPIKATQRETEPVYRLASVSAQSLPPLKPGVRPVKPFNYTSNAAALDLTLVPLPPPKTATPGRLAPQTPYSAIASTLHVTVPSVPSPDRTVSTTPAMLYGKTPVPPLAIKSKSARSSPLPLPSEEYRHRPLHVISPSMSTRVPKTPQGTPMTAPLRQHLFTREALSPSKVLSDHDEQSVEITSSPSSPHPPVRTGTAESPLGTIRETAASTYPTDGSITGPNSRSNNIASSKQLLSSVSPYGFNEGFTGQNSEKDPVPITPAPTSAATEDSWPNVDERDFLHSSPDEGQDPLLAGHQAEHSAPVAPPPSPEPRDANPDFEYQMPDDNKSAHLSLTPLAEEEEELHNAVKTQELLPGDSSDTDGGNEAEVEDEDTRKKETSADSGVVIEGGKEKDSETIIDDDKQCSKTKYLERMGLISRTSIDVNANQTQSVVKGEGKILHELQEGATQSDVISRIETKQSDDITSNEERTQRDDVTSKTGRTQNKVVTFCTDDANEQNTSK